MHINFQDTCSAAAQRFLSFDFRVNIKKILLPVIYDRTLMTHCMIQ